MTDTLRAAAQAVVDAVVPFEADDGQMGYPVIGNASKVIVALRTALAQPAPPPDGWLASMDPALRPHEHVQPAPPLPIGEPPMHVHDGIGLHHAETHHRPADYAAQPAPTPPDAPDVVRLARAISAAPFIDFAHDGWFDSPGYAAAIAREYAAQPLDVDRSKPCITDAKCCRYQGHPGEHIYPRGQEKVTPHD